MQNFSYHTHTNTFGIYDGRCSAREMVSKAEEAGYVEMGISNHLCIHPSIKNGSRMTFSDKDIALDIYKRTIDVLREETKDAKIKILIGFEVDFFESKEWRNSFEKMLSQLEVDYLIGASHFAVSKDESEVISFYDNVVGFREDADDFLELYWQRIGTAVESGYFDFLAHIDLPKVWQLCASDKWNRHKEKMVQTICDFKHPVELNTSGWNKCEEQHPTCWILESLNRAEVPVVISDDAHHTSMIAQHFERAEGLLAEIGYKKRFKL